MIRSLLFFIVFASIAIGCNEMEDSERPVVSIESPQNGDVVTTDNGIPLRAVLTDNTGLLQYKIVISGIDSLNGIGADSTFSTILIDGIPGKPKSFIIDHTIALDENTFNGFYQLTLTCVDVEGNEALRDTVLFQISNSIDNQPPVIDVNSMVLPDTLRFGEGFVLSGTVSDESALIFSDIFIGRTNFSDTVRYTDFPWISNNLVDYTNEFTWWHQVDSTWSQGAYHIYYTAWDNYSGVSHAIPFYVKY